MWLFRRRMFLYLFVAMLAITLRLPGLADRDFWYDEAFTGITIRESWPTMLETIGRDIHPPLYYLLLKAQTTITGSSVVALRSFSLVFGVATVLLSMRLAWRIYGQRAGFYTGVIAALSPFAIAYSQEARMYSLVSFFIVALVYAYLQQRYLLAGILMGLALSTHYIAFLFLPLVYAVSVYNRLGTVTAVIGSYRRVIHMILPTRSWWTGIGAGALTFLPWLPLLIRHLMETRETTFLDWIPDTTAGAVPYILRVLLFGAPLGEGGAGLPEPIGIYALPTVVVTSVVIATIVTSLNMAWRAYGKAGLVPLGLAGIFFLTSYIAAVQGYNFMVPRYAAPAAFLLYLGLGVGLSSMRLRTQLVTGLWVCFVLIGLQPIGYSQGWNELRQNAGMYADQHWYALNTFDYVIAKYYFGSGRVTLYNVDWPAYDPQSWAAVGNQLRQVDSLPDIAKDRQSIIVHNTIAPLEFRHDKSFQPTGCAQLNQFDRIILYQCGHTESGYSQVSADLAPAT